MSTRLPKYRIRDGEPADPRLFNENLVPVMNEANGRLNEHNVANATFPRSRVAQKAYYDFYTAEQDADPKFELNQGACVSTDPHAYRVPDTAEWAAVNNLSVNVPSGEDMLWVLGWAQYGMNPPIGGQYSVSPTATANMPRLQFAVRVDGTVLESSISGMVDVSWAAPRPIYPQTPKKDNLSIHTFQSAGCQSMMIHVHPVRVQAHVPVSEGTHVVEIVVRRIAQDQTSQGGPPDLVAVYNRKMVVVKIIQNAGATGTSNNGSVTAREDGDVMSVANLYTNGVLAAANKLNALSDGNIMRHGLRHEHLPSQIAFPCQVGLTTGNTTTKVYPGHGTDGNPGGGAGQWVYIDDGAATNLETTNGPFDFTANPGFVLLLSNVFVNRVHTPGAETTLQFGCLGTATKFQSGVYSMKASATCYTNSPNTNPGDTGAGAIDSNEPMETDMPLMEFFDYRLAPPAGGVVEKYYVVGSTWGNAVVPTLTWRRSNMMMLIFRK